MSSEEVHAAQGRWGGLGSIISASEVHGAQECGEDAIPSPLHPSSTAHRSDRESLVPSLLKWKSMVDSVLSPLHSWLEASLGF